MSQAELKTLKVLRKQCFKREHARKRRENRTEEKILFWQRAEGAALILCGIVSVIVTEGDITGLVALGALGALLIFTGEIITK